METIIIASSREGAGKTSIIVGIATALEKTYGYIKPFGDRLIYRRKKNWDYDANLIVNILGLEEEPDKISLGFNHSKLRYVYNEDATRTTCQEMADNSGKDKDVLFVEGGKDLTYGASIHLDAIALSKYLNGKLVIVVSGDSDTIVDDIRYINKYIKTQDAGFAGIIINKVQDLEEFENVFLKGITDLGINVLGVIPYKEQLTHFTMNYLAENLFAKVIAGEKGLGNVVKNIFVGAMSTDESLRNPLFIKEQKLLITSGDRSDMILAALESDTVGILLTNNILPPANIITRASEKNIPLLLVANDTFMVSKQLDRMEALLTKDSENEIELLAQLVTKYVKLDELIQ
ncbi:MAG TPA: DRTGG domain-containing protein [Spirochaetota bacterium]|nr:DRTGG domain-containing protein [Spirochaetota bacterium]HPJ38044.1 DRTGG domain-containing protein [Spirochaetota bacterium]HPQ52434.1 DRTGG domain-containing protein [Spirochaetota bacterium]